MSVKLASRPVRTRPVIIAAVLALAGLLATAGQAGSARAATVRTEHAAAVTGTGSAKPAIVLVHGAWADSGSWNAVIGLLQRAGYTVYAPPNPLEGLAIDTATLADFLHAITGPIVLVGHSYGGEVITNAATGDSQVKALVYDDAYLPKQGEDLTDLTTAGSCFAVQDLSTVFNFVPDPVSPSGRSPTSSRPCSPAASPTACRPAPARCWPLPSGPWPPARLPTSPVSRPGRPSRPGTSSALSRPHHHPGRAAIHGQPGTRPHHRDQRPPPVNDHRPGGRGQRHHPGGPCHQLTSAAHPAPVGQLALRRQHDHLFRRAGSAQRGVRRDRGVRRASLPDQRHLAGARLRRLPGRPG